MNVTAPEQHRRPAPAAALTGFVLVWVAVTLSAIIPARSPQHFEWSTSAPEAQGISSSRLQALKSDLEIKKSTSLLVIRNDAIVYEWYAEGAGRTKTHYTASMAKAVVGGLSLGVALTDHRLGLDDLAAKYVPQWKGDPRKAQITIRQLGSHTSGLDDAEADNLAHEKLTGWKGDFWKQLEPPNDPFTIARDLTPAVFEPGQTFQYSNPGIAMLTYAVTASLRDSRWPDIRTLLHDRVMQPIGVADEEWSIGYGKTYRLEGLPLVAAWGGGAYTARAAARVGRLMMRQGDWDGVQLLDQAAVRQVTSDAGTPGIAAMGWWSNNDNRYPTLPRDTFWGSGAGHQVLIVIPSLKLIAVRNGESLGNAQEHHDTLNAILFTPLVQTIVAGTNSPRRQAAYPPSPVISRIEWAPPETIVRRAEGSDNFPITWGDDNQLYTAYGDGRGFAPFVAEKLSLGFAVMRGTPLDFTGMNIRSATGEQRGDGPRGRKASGMLMVNGVLYMWTRNAGNAQLAWSPDHARTWTWSDWKFRQSFGCPGFVNFGRNYAGARDNYVYIYSHDSDTAYAVADRMVLARVPRDRIRDRDAYEFFKGLSGDRQPMWTKNIDERSGVFENPGGCYRSGMTFNAALRRYLWCQIGPDQDSRFAGGLGIYDAPEPWGPWTTAYFTDRWDVGPGESASFPSKWMSADGRRLYLVFSGNDSLSVRRAVLTLPSGRSAGRTADNSEY